jgi:hypothetical protein
VIWKLCNVPGLREDNWVWSPQYSINMHLPERWGFIQFSNDDVNGTTFVRPTYWHVYVSLVYVYDAEKVLFYNKVFYLCLIFLFFILTGVLFYQWLFYC